METKTYIIKSPNKMEALGKKLSRQISGGDIILLTGELGAGKTVLCKGLAKGLNVKAQVVSPTFTIMNEYFGDIKFCHFDAYRLENADEAAAAGLTDFFGADDTVCAVEWWQNIKELFDGCRTIKITINKIDEKKREVTVEK
ncbi:MAG: tRNA (adenosine(37)-N6)-threonylcarbamoyltransferase complex ATPase subunit type 1 TsaE [Clostridiales bacterium]|nr:tRNA (adenosine(37)-N6)-threonylcarbamoyltransferase complex ATPase subunit type 1 TsaE [Clostridiales bacterium]